MLVISQSNSFYVVQTRHDSAGSSFIRKRDVGQFTPDCEPGYAVVVNGPVGVNSYFSKDVIAPIAFLKLPLPL